MNLIPKICEMLGVEIGEEFRIKWPTCKKPNEEFYKFTKDGFIYYDQAMCEWEDSIAYVDLISGKAEVVKKPFEPKDGEQYWFIGLYDEKPTVMHTIWNSADMTHYERKYSGNVFRGFDDSHKMQYEIYEKLTGKKWSGVAE